MEKFEEDLIKLKNKINSMTLSDEFKENLSKKLDMEYERMPDKKPFLWAKQIVAACACCIVLTSCVLADSIGNVITNFFSNTSKEMEAAIESGELQSLNMDYVERDGVSIKVDYAMVKDDSLYLVFNVLSEEEIEKVRFTDFSINSEDSGLLYDKQDMHFRDVNIDYHIKRLKDKEIIFFLELSNIKNIQNYSNIKVLINEIIIISSNKTSTINNTWNFDIEIN